MLSGSFKSMAALAVSANVVMEVFFTWGSVSDCSRMLLSVVNALFLLSACVGTDGHAVWDMRLYAA